MFNDRNIKVLSKKRKLFELIVVFLIDHIINPDNLFFSSRTMWRLLLDGYVTKNTCVSVSTSRNGSSLCPIWLWSTVVIPYLSTCPGSLAHWCRNTGTFKGP